MTDMNLSTASNVRPECVNEALHRRGLKPLLELAKYFRIRLYNRIGTYDSTRLHEIE
jgi:hypothetical protein